MSKSVAPLFCVAEAASTRETIIGTVSPTVSSTVATTRRSANIEPKLRLKRSSPPLEPGRRVLASGFDVCPGSRPPLLALRDGARRRLTGSARPTVRLDPRRRSPFRLHPLTLSSAVRVGRDANRQPFRPQHHQPPLSSAVRVDRDATRRTEAA